MRATDADRQCATRQALGKRFETHFIASISRAPHKLRCIHYSWVLEMAEQTFSEILSAITDRCRDMDAPLRERLQAIADEVDRLSPEFAAIVQRMLGHLRKIGAGEAAPLPGEVMPAFVLPDQDGRLVALEDLLQSGPVVLSFHRGQWCPYCQINADALAKMEPEVAKLGANIVAVTPNLERFNSELVNYAGASYPVLSDLDNGYALECNLAIRVPDEKRRAMTVAGWDISDYQASEAWMLPIPATFVIGSDGVVRARFVDPDYRKRMAIDDILAALRST
jgi:peroxiredoxin